MTGDRRHRLADHATCREPGASADPGFTMPPEPAGTGQAAAAARRPAMSLGVDADLAGAGRRDRRGPRGAPARPGHARRAGRAAAGAAGRRRTMRRRCSAWRSCRRRAAGDRSAAGRHDLGDRRAGAGGAGAPAGLSGGKIVACQLVEACSRTLGGAIGRRYKPAQLRSRTGRGVPRLPTSPGGSAARGKAGPARHDDHPTPRLPADRG